MSRDEINNRRGCGVVQSGTSENKKKKSREDERKKRILKRPRTKYCQNSRLILKWSFKIKTKRQNKNANRIRQKKNKSGIAGDR